MALRARKRTAILVRDDEPMPRRTPTGGAASDAGVARARPGARHPVGYAEGLKALGLTSFGGEPLDLPAVQIGGRIRQARQMRGLSQADLALSIGCRQADLSNIELGKGRDGPTYRTLRALAEALNIELPINPVREADSLLVEIAELGEVSQSQTSFQTCRTLLTRGEWKDLWTTVHLDLIGQVPDRHGIGPVSQREGVCRLVHIEPDSKARIRFASNGTVVARVKGEGQLKVKAAVKRYGVKSGNPAVAILDANSEVEVQTGDEGITFMMLPAMVFLDEQDIA